MIRLSQSRLFRRKDAATIRMNRVFLPIASTVFVDLLCVTPPRSTAQPTDHPAAGQAAANPESAYKLPPDKLAKAVAISRIRNILDIAGPFWGLVAIWMLLGTRAAAGLQAWAERVFSPRWLQGLAFFAVLITILTLANLPLDVFSHVVSRGYGISVQGWASWMGDQGKALALAVILGSLILLF